MQRSNHAVGVRERPKLSNPGRVDNVCLNPNLIGHIFRIENLICAPLPASDHQRSTLLKVNVEAAAFTESSVEGATVVCELGEHDGGAAARDKPRRVPRRPTRDVV